MSTRASSVTPNGASERYDIATAELLVEVGRRKMVGGQEDMIVDIALDLARNAER